MSGEIEGVDIRNYFIFLLIEFTKPLLSLDNSTSFDRDSLNDSFEM